MPTLKRNAPCWCGSGKKYKNCCLQKDLETSRRSTEEDEKILQEETQDMRIATWKIFLLVTAILGGISLAVYLFGFPRAASALFGCGMLVLIVYSAFRFEPSVRKDVGDGGNIDFGNRMGIQSNRKQHD